MSERRSGILIPYGGAMPKIAPDAFIADNAVIIGNVEIGAGASVWFGVVLRGDLNKITIGPRTNIQDGSIIHVAGKRYPTVIGADVLIGHAVVGEGFVLGDRAFIGMKSTILEGTTIEGGAMLAAGSLLTPRKHMKAGELWGGSPAKMMRQLTPEDVQGMTESTDGYTRHAQTYRRERGY
jgi:carbonic anhydrase/acetyltransferase-like protein (isoleucine patch superfamily)